MYNARVETSRKAWYRDVDGILKISQNYIQQRNSLFTRLFQSRPLGELRKAIDLFRALQYQEAIQSLVENVLTKQVSADYFHMGLCYVSRCFARVGMLSHAESLFAQVKDLDLPQSYSATASKLEDEVRKDIDECRRRFVNDFLPFA